MQVRIESEDDALTLATADNLIICLWTGPPTVDAVRLFSAVNRRMRREHPEGAAMVNLVVRGAPKFSREIVEESVAALNAVKTWRSATVHVIMIESFAAVAVRSFLSTLNLVSMAKRPVHVCGDIPAAARWLAETLEGHPSLSWTEPELISALGGLVAPRQHAPSP